MHYPNMDIYIKIIQGFLNFQRFEEASQTVFECLRMSQSVEFCLKMPLSVLECFKNRH